MASYSNNQNIQNLVYGATNTDLDAACTAARDAATSVINAKLNISTDLASPSNQVTRCCTLLAAGMISSTPTDRENNSYWKTGMELLNSLVGETDTDAEWGDINLVEMDG